MADHLPEAVDSVIGTRCKLIELIVVDDGSTDQTPSVVEHIRRAQGSRYRPIHVIRTSRRGKSAAINRALSIAGGEYLTILDADDKLPPFSLASRYQKARETGADLVIGGFATFDGDQRFGYRPPPLNASREELIDKLLFNPISPFHQNSMFMSQSLVNRTGPFDERLKRAQDRDYAIRLIEKAWRIAVTDRPVYLYRRYNRGCRHRFKMRLLTLRYTMTVIHKHTGFVKRWTALAWGLLVEIAKLAYECFGVYRY